MGASTCSGSCARGADAEFRRGSLLNCRIGNSSKVAALDLYEEWLNTQIGIFDTDMPETIRSEVIALTTRPSRKAVPAALHKLEFLLLGVTFDGMQVCLQGISFPCDPDASVGWRTDGLYRRASDDRWITEEYGEPSPYDSCICRGGLTGYDVTAAIRNYLRATGGEEISLAGLLMLEENTGVGLANVFYSHVHGLPIEEALCVMRRIKDGPGLEGKDTENLFIWIDYFSVRQCMNDFRPPQVVALVQYVGTTVVELESKFIYLQRAFCVFEAYATVTNDAELICIPFGAGNSALTARPPRFTINTADARASRQEDKRLIDEYIEDTIGFQAMNTILQENLRNACITYSTIARLR